MSNWVLPAIDYGLLLRAITPRQPTPAVAAPAAMPKSETTPARATEASTASPATAAPYVTSGSSFGWSWFLGRLGRHIVTASWIT
jgi:hypothetical protein